MSAGVTVPVTFHVGGNWAAQLKAIGDQSKAVGKSITGIGNVSALGKLGDKLQKTSEGLHKFRLGVEEVTEQLFIFGAQGSSLVNEIENIRDPLKRLELAQLALSGQTSMLGTALTGVTQRFAEMKTRAAIAVGGVENLTLIMGAATVAGGVLAGVIGTVLKGAYDRAANGLEKYIEKNKEAQALQEFTAQAADANAKQLGGAIYTLSSDFKLAEAASTSFFDKYLANAAKVLQGTTTYSKAIQDVWGVQLPSLLTPALDMIGKVGAGFGNAALHLDKFAAITNKLAAPLRTTQGAVQTLTKTFDGQRVAIDQLRLALSTYGTQLDEVATKARKATPFLDALAGGQGTRQSEELGAPHFEAKRASGGAGIKRRDAARRAFGSALAGQVGDFGARGGEGAGAAAGLGGLASEAAGRRAGAGVLGGAGSATGGAVSDKDVANLAKGAAQGKLLTSILNDGKSAAQGLAGSLADVAAGLASGSIKAGDFGSAIKGAFGSIFKDLGRGFVLQGTALLFTPGGQAAGAGMIAAGLGLSVLGGAMSRGGGGSSSSASGGGGGSAAAGAVSAAARQAAGATPQEARGPSTVVLRVGERELQGTLVELTQDGQARGMGRRMRR